MMFRRLFFSIVLVLGVLSSAAQVQFTPRRLDMGTIKEVDGVAEAVFTYKNMGKEPLVVISVATSCGCTGVEYPQKPLKAGDSARLVVRYDPRDRPGAFERKITVRTSAGDVDLVVEGQVTPRPRTVEDDYPYWVAPGIRLGALSVVVDRAQVGKPFMRTVGVANVSLTMPTVVEIDRAGLPEWVEAKVKKPFLAAGERTEIQVRLTGQAVGGFETDLVLVVDGRPLAEKIWVSALFTRPFSFHDGGNPKLELSQFFYHFSTRKLGEKLEHRFELRNGGTTDLVIDKVESTLPAEVRASVSKTVLAPGQKAILTVEAMPQVLGVFNEAVRLFTNEARSPVRDVRVMANVE